MKMIGNKIKIQLSILKMMMEKAAETRGGEAVIFLNRLRLLGPKMEPPPPPASLLNKTNRLL